MLLLEISYSFPFSIVLMSKSDQKIITKILNVNIVENCKRMMQALMLTQLLVAMRGPLKP